MSGVVLYHRTTAEVAELIVATDRRLAVSGSATSQCVQTYYELQTGEAVEVDVIQDSGAVVHVWKNQDESPEFWMVKLP